jgi:formate dehydrogenase gamma subunit
VPLFLYFKGGGIEALREVRLTRDDLRWIARKPLAMLGLSRRPLPPQDKYNAGQKLFAISALIGTTLIIATGVVMTLHLGPPALIRAAIVTHKLAILLALVGLAVHITMAAIITEERPALRSMITGTVDREHAEHHSQKWVEEISADTTKEHS